MVVPVDRQIEEAHDVSHKARSHFCECEPVGAVRDAQFQNHDGDQDGDDAVTECSQAVVAHAGILLRP